MVAKRSLGASETDVLELAANDSDIYLSDIDEPPKKLCSAIVKPKPQNHRAIAIETRGFGHSKKRAHTPRVERQRGATHKPRGSPVESNHSVAQTTTKTFETRGTQTERTGPCKCARAVKAKNQRRRLDSKKNKQLVAALVNHHTQRA